MSKQLAADYKVPMPHVAVRDKIRKRAPGSEPQQGDRVSFVIVSGPGKMFEKAEDPGWVRERGIPLDYQYYFAHQFRKPVEDLLEPLIRADDVFDARLIKSTTEAMKNEQKQYRREEKAAAELEARRAFLTRFTKGLKLAPS